MRGVRVLPASVALLIFVLARPVAGAAWSAVGLGGGAARASFALAAPPPTPSVTSDGVLLAWPAQASVDAYRVRRFDISGSPQVPGGACASPVASASCLDSPAPSGTWTYALTALRGGWTGSEGPRSSPVAVTRRDSTPPVVSAAGLLRTGGSVAGFLRPGGSYRIYASASDVEAGSSGIATVLVDASQLTAGASAVSLSVAGGPWIVGGTTYPYRSAELIASTSLVNGATAQFGVTATDGAGNIGQANGSASIDATVPSAQDVQTVNAGTAGRADAGDYVVFTFSEPIDPVSLIAGWDGSPLAQVIVRITDGGAGNDVLTVWNSANSQAIPLGNLNLERSDYVSGTVVFGLSGTQSRISASGNTVTVTLGTPDLASRTTGGTGSANSTWNPSGNMFDRAGNACSVTARTEGGSRDREF